ncbi:unnamed protein product [Brassicogethes aeneus]|uniref:protein-serine/threonine phosphatase n=1 Tax=Brassicogethes aeneus TaxID=1431903 RepID=A0A9P0FJJ4_BRAAE|nr:unnamed protein product [Brassicogethes aeneus]
MGSYLSEPLCEKISSDEINDKLKCGASSMQGWRVSQEDAHNCILEYDNNCSFFAVYDGHGGHEVAQYCSQKLPEFIKQLQTYKDGDIEKALIEGFLGFDATIATKDVIAILKEIAGDKEAEEDEDDEENVDNLYKEATMPIEKVIEKYTNLVNPAVRNLKAAEAEKLPKSPNLKAKKETADVASSSNSSASEPAGSSNPAADAVTSSSADSSEAKTADDDNKPANGGVPEIKVSSPDSSDADKKEADAGQAKASPETPHQNGDVSESKAKDDVSSSSPHENGDVKGKGKALAKKSVKPPQKVIARPKRNANQLYRQLLDFGGGGVGGGDGDNSDEDSEDEEDKTFEGPQDLSDDDDDDDEEEEGVNASLDDEDGDDGDDESSDEEDEEDGDEEDEDDESYQFVRNMKEEPGSDSGCTAVVAFLKGNELYVANAGDSRCIVCRNGKAVEMSFDHKPEDDPERLRVTKAGGKVTSDGRVNGGLNLSRAIGDHAYKQNAALSDREQMITALPDVKTCTVNPGEDEFMVLACDGIWNFMSSQEVVDFVRPRIEDADNLSTICEEMFDHCLAPNTMGDGTGCDNMTCIIVQFKSNILKRPASPEPEASKRQKTEQKVESTAS